ncbi:uncharacterized protein Z519_12732 [Cladophialophora bantiana CBS 173.52]|uniref:Uncharacterized protein n=1 Tax=Cladophialophora bantiana (strain ATCC 10958 / CBS 173.52 / CDC B-1940 / NIH 8579) TaxID=1442370 RepID=A0A0D2FIZ7_CLAB1|nr:uncharacterized protein Z519_12732 [Cladophialophora bantiana CBS 173.52]KIW86677.1 hypothetical protein Z519_12732 [Cladophialophora bantiana CBS 173.52]
MEDSHLEQQRGSTFDFTASLEGYWPNSLSLPATPSGSSSYFIQTPIQPVPVVQAYQAHTNTLQIPFSAYIVPAATVQYVGSSVIHPNVIHCRLCGQVVSGTATLTSEPSPAPVLSNTNHNQLKTFDDKQRAWNNISSSSHLDTLFSGSQQ